MSDRPKQDHKQEFSAKLLPLLTALVNLIAAIINLMKRV